MILTILLLGILTSCGKITKIEYLTTDIPDSPPAPTYYEVKWEYINELYCVNETNAKNFIKNKKIQDSYTKTLENILENMRNRKNDLVNHKKAP